MPVKISRAELRELREGTPVVPGNTPNVVISNERVRLWMTIVLAVLTMLSTIAAMTLDIFPELEVGGDIVGRIITLTNQILAFLISAFGLSVVAPNIPRRIR